MKRLALIGLGMGSPPHVQSFLDLAGTVELAAAYSPSADRRQAFADRWKLPTTGDFDAILADPAIDGLVVVTPPNTHGEIVAKAARAGKHVLLEKPLEVSTERATALVEAMEAAGLTLGIVLQHRFRPVALAMRGLVTDGRLGEIVGASAKLANWRPQGYYDVEGRGTRARDGGGVLLTQGIHTLDLLIAVAGMPVEATGYAATTPVHRMETEDLAAGAIRFGNGALGTIHATTCAFPGLPDAIELIGTKGTARIEGTALIAQFHDGTELRHDDHAAGGGAGADPMAFPHQHHRAVLADFVAALETGGAPGVSGREALKVHRLIDALLRSAATGQRETV